MYHHDLNPIALQLGPLAIHWYGIMYILGLLAAWGLGSLRLHRVADNFTQLQFTDLIFYTALGLIIGGRCGYMLFYAFPEFLHAPWIIFKIWEGGMSFHGGLIGALIAIYCYSHYHHYAFLTLCDFLAPLVPVGLMLGRIGNFINGELWGKVTTVPWGVVFPYAGSLPRHPSQLYEALTEGLLLFIILWLFTRQPKPQGSATGLFLTLYGVARFLMEIWREPDLQLGYLIWHLSMGQLLSAPLIIIGLFLIIRAYQNQRG